MRVLYIIPDNIFHILPNYPFSPYPSLRKEKSERGRKLKAIFREHTRSVHATHYPGPHPSARAPYRGVYDCAFERATHLYGCALLIKLELTLAEVEDFGCFFTENIKMERLEALDDVVEEMPVVSALSAFLKYLDVREGNTRTPPHVFSTKGHRTSIPKRGWGFYSYTILYRKSIFIVCAENVPQRF
jgi:hypothetical protein